nr:hypothetical protein [Tanacetum cinerariifolium]
MHTYTGRRSPGSSLFTSGFILEVGVGSVYILPPPYLAPTGLGMLLLLLFVALGDIGKFSACSSWCSWCQTHRNQKLKFGKQH